MSLFLAHTGSTNIDRNMLLMDLHNAAVCFASVITARWLNVCERSTLDAAVVRRFTNPNKRSAVLVKAAVLIHSDTKTVRTVTSSPVPNPKPGVWAKTLHVALVSSVDVIIIFEQKVWSYLAVAFFVCKKKKNQFSTNNSARLLYITMELDFSLHPGTQ